MSFNKIKSEIASLGSPEKAKLLSRYFKTGKGEYGEGDIFLGLTVPDIRKIARKYKHVSLEEAERLLKSKIHEERLCALLILIEKFNKGDEKARQSIYESYLKNTAYVNNWDLVDLSCRFIIGEFIINKKRDILYNLAHSDNLWERRISIISTFAFIRRNEFRDSLKLAEILLHDKQDLIHKAVGWVLREVGKKNQKVEEDFLIKHYKTMPRTALRYAIERFPKERREAYLKGAI